MSKLKSLKLFFVTLIFLSVLAMAFNVAPFTAKADVGVFTMEKGASVRLSGDGIRFKVKMDQDTKNVVDTDATLHFLVAPRAIFDDVTNGQYINLAQKVDITVDETKIYQDDDFYYANGVLTGLYNATAQQQQNIEFVSIAYISTGDSVIYANFADANIDNNTRTQYEVINEGLLYDEEDISSTIFSSENIYSNWYGTDAFPVRIDNLEDYDALVAKVNAGVTFDSSIKFVINGEVDTTQSSVAVEGVLPALAKVHQLTVLDAKDGEVISDKEVVDGSTISITAPEKESIDAIEFTFDKWLNAADDTEVTTITSNITIYPSYTAKETVEFTARDIDILGGTVNVLDGIDAKYVFDDISVKEIDGTEVALTDNTFAGNAGIYVVNYKGTNTNYDNVTVTATRKIYVNEAGMVLDFKYNLKGLTVTTEVPTEKGNYWDANGYAVVYFNGEWDEHVFDGKFDLAFSDAYYENWKDFDKVEFRSMSTVSGRKLGIGTRATDLKEYEAPIYTSGNDFEFASLAQANTWQVFSTVPDTKEPGIGIQRSILMAQKLNLTLAKLYQTKLKFSSDNTCVGYFDYIKLYKEPVVVEFTARDIDTVGGTVNVLDGIDAKYAFNDISVKEIDGTEVALTDNTFAGNAGIYVVTYKGLDTSDSSPVVATKKIHINEAGMIFDFKYNLNELTVVTEAPTEKGLYFDANGYLVVYYAQQYHEQTFGNKFPLAFSEAYYDKYTGTKFSVQWRAMSTVAGQKLGLGTRATPTSASSSGNDIEFRTFGTANVWETKTFTDNTESSNVSFLRTKEMCSILNKNYAQLYDTKGMTSCEKAGVAYFDWIKIVQA